MGKGPVGKRGNTIYVYALTRDGAPIRVGQSAYPSVRLWNMRFESQNGYWRWPVEPNGIEILELVKNSDHIRRRKAAMISEMMWIHTFKKEGYKLFNVMCNCPLG